MTSPEATDDALSTEAPINVRTAGRGGLAVTFSKLYFMGLGLVQQTALVWVLDVGGYGAFRSAQSPANITYNPLVTTGIQGVSRAVVNASPETRAAATRQVLLIHAGLALIVALTFFFVAPAVVTFLGAPHVAGAVRIVSIAVLVYGVYGPLIGVLNGTGRFFHQAGFDMLATTLRTIGLVAGAWLVSRAGQPSAGVEGAMLGFVASSTFVFLLAAFVVGFGKKGPGAPSVMAHLRFLAPLLLAQVVLNLLLQADTSTLRYFASRAAFAAGQTIEAADPLVGAYNATQLFGFLPYQLLMGLTFVLFPLLARAHQDGERERIGEYVQTGVRLALIVVGTMVAVTSGLSEQLLLLIYPRQAAELGAASMAVLTLGLGCFAVLGTLLTILTSIKAEVVGLVVTALGFGLVLAMNTLFLSGREFGPELLWWTALSTSLGVLATTLVAARVVYVRAGAVVSALVLGRVLAALVIATGIARLLPSAGRVVTLAESALVATLFLTLLALFRELGPRDLELVRRVVSRRK